MEYDRFVHLVTQAAGIDRARAERAVQATLATREAVFWSVRAFVATSLLKRVVGR